MKLTKEIATIAVLLVVLALFLPLAFFWVRMQNPSLDDSKFVPPIQPKSGEINPVAEFTTYTDDTYLYEYSCPKQSLHSIANLGSQANGQTIPLKQETCSEGSNQVTIQVWKNLPRPRRHKSGSTFHLT